MSNSTTGNLASTLGFDVDINQVLRNLNSDMFDEWYYDCLNYQDLLKAIPHVAETIELQVGKGLGRYQPQPRVARDIPKKGLPVRYSLETDFYDRYIYQAICSFLINFFDPLLSHRVLSHRRSEHSKKYLFQNRIERWLTYEGVTFTFKGDKKYLLVTDLANYYENIRTKDIIGAFESLLPDVNATPIEQQQIRNALVLLETCLKKWNFKDGFGLPQNRDASSFLANVVLRDVDKAMEKMGYDYYRYVDDIRIICESENHAKKALLDLIGQLRGRGLNVNSAKTTILSHDSPAGKIHAEFPNRDPRVVAIEQMWKSRDKIIILRSIKYLISLLVECIENDETQSRAFRFSANRLAQLSDLGVLAPEQLKGKLPEILVQSMFQQPASTDQYCKILNFLALEDDCIVEIQNFLIDRSRAIHDWQNYHFWMLLAKKSIKSAELRKSAISILESGMYSAEAGAIIIWADQIGYKSVVNMAVGRFEADLPFQLQRYFAIATRNFSSQKLIQVYPKISDRVKGTKDRSRQFENDAGKIDFPVREVPMNNLFDEMNEYD